MIEKSEIERVAGLARLKLEDTEVVQLSAKLSTVLEYFNQIKKIDTQNVLPLVTPTEMVQVLRADEVCDSVGAESALSQAPERVGNLFKVPPVV